MTDKPFTELEQLTQSDGPGAAIERLIETLREQKDYHRLFDALLLKHRYEMGLPLTRPTSFDDVPEEQQREFQDRYIDSAREIGELLLADGRIPHAWVYLRTIGEPHKVTEAIEQVEVGDEPDEETEELLNIAVYEGANPVKGLEIMLKTHGTCNTITALDQIIQHLRPEDRRRAAELLVDDLYADLTETLKYEIEQNLSGAPLGDSIGELIKGRDWLFEEGNYHIDVSHLNAVVRFARSLEPGSAKLPKAIELAEYGSRLDPQFQYNGDPPFDEFYPASVRYFQVLADDGREEALDYFRNKLAEQTDEDDRKLAAYVLVDLLTRIGRTDEALELADKHLKGIEDQATGFSFAELCRQAGRMDTLRDAAREQGDLVGYTAALVQESGETVSA